MLDAAGARPADPLPTPIDGGPLSAFGAAVPELLLGALERRYLGNFEPARWQLGSAAESSVRPTVSPVLELGRLGAGATRTGPMAQALTALHTPGQATVMAVFGDGDGHRLHYGGRRLGPAAGSTTDFLARQAGVLRGRTAGLRLGGRSRLDDRRLPELATFLESAPALGVLTGVPSIADGAGTAAPGLEQLAAALGRRRYAIVVVAEPVDTADLDDALDRCRRLRSELTGLARRSVMDTSTSGTSDSTTRRESDPKDVIPMALSSLALFCDIAGAFSAPANPVLKLAVATLGPGLARAWSDVIMPPTSVQTGTSSSRGRSETVELLNANAEAGLHLLQRHIERLDAARAVGWWRVAVYLAGDSDAALDLTAGTLRSMYGGPSGTPGVEPARLIRPAPWLVRQAMIRGEILPLRPTGSAPGHPLGPAFDALATCLTSPELAVVTAPPRDEMPGIPVRDVADFSVNVPPVTADSVPLGTLRGNDGDDLQPVALSEQALNRHVFVTGMTGYGKTTTTKFLLTSAFRRLDVPFLVVEPVKAEYRALAGEPALRGRLRVFSIGGDHPLRLNPFLPVASVPLARHIDLLKGVFNAAFPMYAGMPYILEEAILEVYADRGWNLHTSRNDALGPHPSTEDLSVLVPTLGDLHDKIEEVLNRKRYGPEVHQNMGAALRSRLNSLMVGAKGLTLNSRRSVSPDELFTRPCVIELRNLGDDEEKCFVIALLLCLLYEYAESRPPVAPGGRRLRHLTVIEEAHRLLRAARPPAGPESADTQAKAVTMFTDMLAEMRAYGEGFVIADQIPTKLAPETLKNSNVKILHRLVAPDDRAVVSSMVNLTEAQSRQLTMLPPGTAVVHDSDLGSAVVVRVTPEPVPSAAALEAVPAHRPDLTYLHLNGACRYCPAPCDFLDPARAAGRAPVALVSFFRAILGAGAQDGWRHWSGWRSGIDPATSPGAVYCAATQAGHRWLGEMLAGRATLGAPAGPAVRPADRLLHDQAARELARLCWDWTGRPDLDGEARSAFDLTRQRLHALVTRTPPRELPGCRDCPARCRALPLIADRLAEVGPGIAARATADTAVPTRIRSVYTLVERLTPPLDAGRLPAPDVIYCLVTTALADRAGEAAEVLAHLRDPA